MIRNRKISINGSIAKIGIKVNFNLDIINNNVKELKKLNIIPRVYFANIFLCDLKEGFWNLIDFKKIKSIK